MADYVSVFFFIFMAVAHLTLNVAALNTESIRGGEYIPNPAFRISVQGRVMHEEKYRAVCGGGILSKSYAISLAYCFIDTAGDLHQASFSIVIGSSDLESSEGERVNVTNIIVPVFNDEVDVFAPAILELGYSLTIFLYPKLSILRSGVLAEVTAKVAGYGVNWFNTVAVEDGAEIQSEGESTFLLAGADVKILNQQQCIVNYGALNTDNKICGVMEPAETGEKRGICTGDGGSVLTLNNDVLIGIASRNRVDCDDTEKGALYTRILPYAGFINSIVRNKWIPPNAIVHQNRAHVM